MTADDLQRFCAGPDDYRTELRAPWSAGAWTYASNGHIIIRVPRLPDVPENEDAPKSAESLFPAGPPADGWMPVPVVEMPPLLDCKWCEGTGKDDLSADCYDCGGTGKLPSMVGMDVGNSHYQQRYIAMVQGWEIAPQGEAKSFMDADPAWLRNGTA